MQMLLLLLPLFFFLLKAVMVIVISNDDVPKSPLHLGLGLLHCKICMPLLIFVNKP